MANRFVKRNQIGEEKKEVVAAPPVESSAPVEVHEAPVSSPVEPEVASSPGVVVEEMPPVVVNRSVRGRKPKVRKPDNPSLSKEDRTSMGLSVVVMEKFMDYKLAYRKKTKRRSISNQEFLEVLMDVFKTQFRL